MADRSLKKAPDGWGQESFNGFSVSAGNCGSKSFARRGKPRLRVIDRSQMILNPTDIDRIIPEDHEVRAIWEITGSWDLSAYYEAIEVQEEEAGRPAYDPRLLLSLWLYAYSKGVSSAREISRLTAEDPPYQWLCGMEPVNYHSLADFRTVQGEDLHDLFVEMLALLSSEHLVILERVMQDGSKVKASAGADTFRSKGRLEIHLKAAEEQVRLMEEMGEQEVAPRLLQARKRAAKERKERLERALANISELGGCQPRASTTDPEARKMKQADGGFAPSYNVQISADSSQRVIVGVSVTNQENDKGLLPLAVEQIEENCGKAPGQVVVDSGFMDRDTICTLDEKQVEVIGFLEDRETQKKALYRRRGVAEGFEGEAFRYDSIGDCYICPEGKVLVPGREKKQRTRSVWIYAARKADCGSCGSKGRCCPRTKRRFVVRSEDAPGMKRYLEVMATEEAKAIYKTRGAVSEFVNAWLKEKLQFRRFRLRGLRKANLEALWVSLAYNVQTWIRQVWKPRWAT